MEGRASRPSSRAGTPGSPPARFGSTAVNGYQGMDQGEHSLKHAIKLAGVAVTVATLASLALCQEGRIYREGSNWVQEVTGDLGAARNLRVKLAAGSVKVQGGSQAGITYTIHRKAYTSSEQQARRAFESSKVNTSVKGETAWIVAESSSGRDHKSADDFVINVPRNLESAKIETGCGSASATGIAGRVDLVSGGGNIHLDDIGGEVTAETGGGTIEVGSVGGGVTLQTGGGNIKIASAKGEIKAESGGGNVVVISGLQGAVLETGGGSIRVDKCSGTVKATTRGGHVELAVIAIPHLKPRLATLPSILRMIWRSRFGRRSKWAMATRSAATFPTFASPAKADSMGQKQ